jgi:hypothetical protein
VLGLHGIFPASQAIFPVHNLSDKGKKNRRMPVPDGGIGGPEAFAAGCLIQNAAELGAGVIDTELQGFIFQNVLHGKTSKKVIDVLCVPSYHKTPEKKTALCWNPESKYGIIKTI